MNYVVHPSYPETGGEVPALKAKHVAALPSSSLFSEVIAFCSMKYYDKCCTQMKNKIYLTESQKNKGHNYIIQFTQLLCMGI